MNVFCVDTHIIKYSFDIVLCGGGDGGVRVKAPLLFQCFYEHFARNASKCQNIIQ